MTQRSHLPHPTAALGLVTGLTIFLSACAQTPVSPHAGSSSAPSPGSAASSAPPAAANPARATAYAGHFESECQQLGEAFYTRDLLDLVPTSVGVESRYAKAFHDAEGCAPASLVVVFHMPAEQWIFDGSFEMQGRTIDRILTRPSSAGQLTASDARPGWLDETPTQFLLRRNGKGRGLPVDKAVDQVPTKELRLLTSQRLYSSAPSDKPDAYPTELDLSSYLQRKPAPQRR